jgi:hypothetical protein
MKGIFRDSVIRKIFSAISMGIFSFSTTQGPAIRKKFPFVV